jgi:hypothetical protein
MWLWELAATSAAMFPSLTFVGVDLKPTAIEILEQRAVDARLANVRKCLTSIEAYTESFDIALSLHACGPASDAVLQAALDQQATFFISPCCVGKLQPQKSVAWLARARDAAALEGSATVDVSTTDCGEEHSTFEGVAESETVSIGHGRRSMSRRLRAVDIDPATYRLMAQLADKSEGTPPGSMGAEGRMQRSCVLRPPVPLPSQVSDKAQAHFLRSRLCKSAVELDRVSWVREQSVRRQSPGVTAHLVRMFGLEGYAKTDMIVGWPAKDGRESARAHMAAPGMPFVSRSRKEARGLGGGEGAGGSMAGHAGGDEQRGVRSEGWSGEEVGLWLRRES